MPNTNYHGFTDPSGGAADSFTLGIAHSEKNRVILDVLREVEPPFSPERVVEDFSAILKQYRCHEVVGDRYAGEWPRERFAKNGIQYRVSEKNRSEIYTEFLPLLTAGCAELQINLRLKAQLVALERRTGRNADVIDHPAGGHDDLANVCAGACVLAAAQGGVLGQVEFLKQLAMNPTNFLLEPYNRPASAEEKAALAYQSDETHLCPDCRDGKLRRCNPKDPCMWRCDCCTSTFQFAPGQAPRLGVNRGEHLRQQDERKSQLGQGTWSSYGFGRWGRR